MSDGQMARTEDPSPHVADRHDRIRVHGARVNKAKLATYARAVDQYERFVCTKNAVVDMATPYSDVLKTWNLTVRNTRRDVVKSLAGT